MDIITVDPGPFTYYYTKNCKLKDEYGFYSLIGSVTPLSLEQMRFAKSHGACVYELDCKKILADEYVEYFDGCYRDLCKIDSNFLIITTSYLDKEYKLDLSNIACEHNSIEDISNKINQRIARLFIKFLKQRNVDCIYTSGGDTTVEFLSQVNSYALRMNSQILPLTVESTILGGDFEGVNLVSKGGLIGDNESLVYIYNYMRVGSNK